MLAPHHGPAAAKANLRAHYAPNQGRFAMPTTLDPHIDELYTVECWRYEVLKHAGFHPKLAHALAADPDVDLHQAVRLLEQGCPTLTALRILL